MTLAATEHESQLIAQFNKLYIINRKPFLQMTKAGGYITVSNRSLADHDVLNHLRHKSTFGVCNKGTKGADGTDVSHTKFMTFDCDGGDGRDKKNPLTDDEKLARAYDQAGSIRRILISKYGISPHNVHVSVSGGKGLHVDLFFSDIIKYKTLETFYRNVIADCGLTEGEVEFRPNGSGVKLPLGKNMKTKRLMVFCAYSDKFSISKSSAKGGTRHFRNMTLAESYKYFLRIQPMDKQEFLEKALNKALKEGGHSTKVFDKDNKLELTEKQDRDFSEVPERTNISDKSPDEYKKHLTEILVLGHMNSYLKRHETTYFLAMYLREQGNEQEGVVEIISDVVSNTFANENTRRFISEDTTEEFALSEVERITKYVFDKNKEFHFIRKKVTISRAEVLKILTLKNFWEKQMMFAFLVHEKKYATAEGESFYMAYSELARYGCDSNRQMCKAKILELSAETGFVEPISMGVKKDKWTDDNRIFETNIYRVQLLTEAERNSKDNQMTLELDTTKKPSFEELVTQLISQDEAKQSFSTRQYYSKLKPLYEAIN